MRRFQVRKWSKPHRGFAKKALAHPSRGRLKRGIFQGSPKRFCEAKDFFLGGGYFWGPPQRFCVSKRFVGLIFGRIFMGSPQKTRSEFCGDLFTPSVLLPTFVGQQDSSLERAPKTRNFSGPQKKICVAKIFWGKEEPTLSAWHSPSGGCPQKASCSDAVPPIGLEPIRLSAQDPKSCASANFATAAYAPS